MEFDALLLSRLQFAFVIAFHIIFPAFTIGLASFLAVLEGLYLFTKKQVFLNLFFFWVKVFALAFGMGVVSGVVMSYQFGTNWSVFADLTGSVLGPLLGYEVLTAFFLEASFLGIMLFGWKLVGPLAAGAHGRGCLSDDGFGRAGQCSLPDAAPQCDVRGQGDGAHGHLHHCVAGTAAGAHRA